MEKLGSMSSFETKSKKYEFTDETDVIWNTTLHRIRALRDFGSVKAGDLGGFLECEKNLSHEGEWWVADHAAVMHSAMVKDDAVVKGNSVVKDCAVVKDNSKIEYACIYKSSTISGCSEIKNGAVITTSGNLSDVYIDGAIVISGTVDMNDVSITSQY